MKEDDQGETLDEESHSEQSLGRRLDSDALDDEAADQQRLRQMLDRQ